MPPIFHLNQDKGIFVIYFLSQDAGRSNSCQAVSAIKVSLVIYALSRVTSSAFLSCIASGFMSLSPIVIKTWKGKESLQSLSFFFLRHCYTFLSVPPPFSPCELQPASQESDDQEIFQTELQLLQKKYQIRGPAGRRLFRISSFLSLYCISRVRTIRSLFFLLSLPPFLPSTFHFRFPSSNFSPCFLLSLSPPPFVLLPRTRWGKREREKGSFVRSFVRAGKARPNIDRGVKNESSLLALPSSLPTTTLASSLC